jgi:hypothetical protein
MNFSRYLDFLKYKMMLFFSEEKIQMIESTIFIIFFILLSNAKNDCI